jgi:RNA polymerase sporulation-specific sigma factor
MENHNLIYDFAKHRNLDIDEYYGILAIGLCNAAKVFDKTKGNFSTVAYKCMQNELYMYWRTTQKKSSIPKEMIVSYNVPLKKNEESGEDTCHIDGLTDYYTPCDVVIDNIMFEDFVNLLEDKEKMIIQMLINGRTQTEIANVMNCRQSDVWYCIRKIHKKWDKYNVI